MQEFLNSVKTALRIKSTAYDSEIIDLINACKGDLVLAGIASSHFDPDDALIKRAVITYCKANFGFNEESEKYMNAYLMIKMHLTLSADYKEEI